MVQKCDTYGNPDAIQSVCEVVTIVRVMTLICGSDVTRIVYMCPYTLDVVSYIEAVMS